MDEKKCPHCKTKIYPTFVKENNRCPSCNEPVTVDDPLSVASGE